MKIEEKIEALNKIGIQFDRKGEQELSAIMSFLACAILAGELDIWINKHALEMNHTIDRATALAQNGQRGKQIILPQNSLSAVIKYIKENIIDDDQIPSDQKERVLVQVVDNIPVEKFRKKVRKRLRLLRWLP